MLGMDMPIEHETTEQQHLEAMNQSLKVTAEPTENPMKAAMNQMAAAHEASASNNNAEPGKDEEVKEFVTQPAAEEQAAEPSTPAEQASEHATAVATKTEIEPIESASLSEAAKAFSPLVKQQLKTCGSILKGLKRHPQAGPFQVPVDPVALGIPDYPEVIKNPMDLSTIQNKFDTNVYKTADSFAADVHLMLKNCFTYNKPETQVYQMGKALEKYFNNAFTKLPTEVSAVQGDDFGKRRKSDAAGQAPTPRPKRESMTPRRPSVIPSTASGRSKRPTPEMSFCLAIWKELTKKSNLTFSWPFLEPVDPIKLGIPDYPTIVTNPMDLSTMKKKLDAGAYPSADAFEADFRLMLNNCYAYNGPDSDVSKLGKELEAVFDNKWAQRHTATSAAAARYDEYDDDSEKILALNKQIQALQQELNELLTKRRGQAAPAKPAPKSRSKSMAPGSAVPSNLPSPDAPMTFEEKRQLSVDVNNLSPEKLGRVVEIIHSSMPYLQQQSDSDVIELDIESLDVGTLRQLQKYIQECKAASQKKRKSSTPTPRAKKAAQAPAEAASTALAPPALQEALSSDDSSSSDDDL